MRLHPDGQYVLEGTSGPTLAIDPRSGDVTIGPGDEAVSVQLVTAFGVPLLLHGYDVLAVHASACEDGSGATIVCGPGGSGKSSTLVRLVDAGWRALSEDVCALDLRGATPMAWPGPPWVRRRRSEPGPDGATARFESPDKTAWDIAPVMAGAPTPVSTVVLLEPPGGDAPRWEPLSQPDAVRAIAQHAMWLRDPADAPERLFRLALQLTRRVECARLRLPRRERWLEDLPEILSRGP
jgi:hypothetical protein